MSIFNKFLQKDYKKNHLQVVQAPSVEEVENYYEKETVPYLNSYGDIIQAARSNSNEEYLDYLIDNMGIGDGMKLLDAGCGVCGPSTYFAQKKDITVDAVTLSKMQVDLSKERIQKADVENKVIVRQGDFHNLHRNFSHNTYDIVFFLESLGYATDLKKVISGALNVIKPNGFLYIKDFFPVPLTKKEQLDRQLEITKEIRREYCYRLLDLVNILSVTREMGFFLVFIRRLDFIEDFTNAANFEVQNGYNSYTRAITNPYQLYEPLQLKFQKIS